MNTHNIILYETAGNYYRQNFKLPSETCKENMSLIIKMATSV